jgi:SAM-dependent methyltransferase
MSLVSWHPDRERGTSFGRDAERYDRARPSYPAELIDYLCLDDPNAVLDVGCGTGIAGRLFAARGCDVLGVEADPRMAEVARRHGLRVEDGMFESWDPRGRQFALVVSGQAWHWVDPELGSAKVALVLRPGGRFSAFWNRYRHSAESREVFEKAYGAHAPELFEDNVPLGTYAFRGGAFGDLERLIATGSFEAPEARSYEWDALYTADQWCDELLTHSIHRSLPESRQSALLDALHSGLERIAPFTVTMNTVALIAIRR